MRAAEKLTEFKNLEDGYYVSMSMEEFEGELESFYFVSQVTELQAIIHFPVVLVGVMFSAVIGIVFGLIPANKASKLNPIDALRYE